MLKFARALAATLFLLAAGCATVSLPPVDLKAPGWTTRQGEAVWHRQRGGEGVAGDLFLATRADGSALVQFSKASFPLVVARTVPGAWSVNFPPQNRHYSGRSRPPARIIFLQLPAVLQGRAPPKHWTWHPVDQGGWRLENEETGEALDVYFNS